MKNKYLFILFSAITFSILSCVTVQTQSSPNTGLAPSYKYNFASLYNPAVSDLHPEVQIYIKSDTEAVVYYKIPVYELKTLNNQLNSDETKLMIKYVIRNSDDFSVADSGSLVNVINLKENIDYVYSYFTVKLPKKPESKIVISMYGQKENSGKRLLTSINNDINSPQRFISEIVDSSGNKIVFGNYVNHDKTYMFTSNLDKNEKLHFDYYKFSEYVSIPPYYMTNYQAQVKEPDSTFSYSLGDTIRFTNKGMYILRKSEQTTGGLCLINASDNYPEIKSVADMLEPLKLLTGNKEYTQIKNSENLKYAIDDFWLSKSQNQKFAKEQIRVFYNRVTFANLFFTEDKEGWKTDRGMIYVLLGPPSIVNINASGEEWFYGENPDVAGILFIFDKYNNPYCGSVMSLRRDSNYQSVWAQALQTWKGGRVYSITN